MTIASLASLLTSYLVMCHYMYNQEIIIVIHHAKPFKLNLDTIAIEGNFASGKLW